MSIILGPESGIYFYFSAAIIAPLFFYTFKEKKYSIAFASLTIILALVVHYFGSDIPPIVNAPELLITGFFYFSVFGSLVTIFGFVFYFYSESNKFERSLEKVNLKLQKLSETDPLTQLPNRRNFYKNLEQEWGKGIRTKNHCAIIMIDVDNFKMFNDLYGHQQGDNCLVSFAKIISQNTRDFLDFPARYGGEEFIILLSDTNLDDAYTIADRIRVEMLRLTIPFQTNKPAKLVTCSMGVASIVPNNEIDPNDLILKADKALYKAKELGRNKVEKSL
jgi:diguanylate cyclase (GGDEF)-like protein